VRAGAGGRNVRSNWALRLNRAPDLLLGALLTVAIFAIGASVGLNYRPSSHSWTRALLGDTQVWLVVGTIGTLLLAAFALWQAIISRQTARRQLRAYVFARPHRAFNVDDRNVTAQVYTIIGNKGSTFAHKVERSVGICILPGPVPERFEDLGPLMREEGVLDLAPGVEGVVIRNLHPLSEDELAKVMTEEGKLRIYAFGKIIYQDAFGKRHTTTFCHAYYGQERLAFNAGFAYADWQAKYCDRHNEAT
jgi:hypothetical protein